jgi:hypothetical protein
LVEVPAQNGSPALRDIGEHSLLLWAERILRFEHCSVTSNDVRNVEAPGHYRAGHGL